MTKENFTAIAVVLDKSGSMAHTANDTIGGLNTFIAEQKNVPGDATFTLVQFNNEVEITHDFVKLADVKTLTALDYRATGGTALYDAIGFTVNKLGAKLSELPEEERPSSIIVAIMTDGEENASKTFSMHKIAEIIKHQESVYSWKFVFLGANQDAVLAAQQLNIAAGAALSYASSPTGYKSAFASVSKGVTRGRVYGASAGSSKEAFFTPDDRKQNDPNAKP